MATKRKKAAPRRPAAAFAEFSQANVAATIREQANSPLKLRDWLSRYSPFITGPSISSFEPIAGPPGTLITLHGSDFSTVREENLVSVGGYPAFVASATSTELKVITSLDVQDGPVKLTIGTHTAGGPQDFMVLGYPDAG